MGPLGVPELIIIFVVALVVFGPRKLPELGRSLGKSLSEFKRASNELRNTLDEEIQNEDRRAALAKTSTTPAAATETYGGSSDGYEAPEDAYNNPSNSDDLPQDDYRVGAGDGSEGGDARETAASAEPRTDTVEAEPDTVARGQHG
jgi:sec-independent protein translocase protein TatA